MKKLCKAISDHVEAVEFAPVSGSDLVAWVSRRFRALDKDIDRQTAEYLIFTCGSLMTGLVQEIGKIAAYAKGKTITEKDIDAARILGDLLKLQTEPILINAALGSQLRRIYTARIALDTGKDRAWLMELWGMKSDYPAKLLLTAAKRTTAQWCADAVRMSQTLDRRLKSERGIDGNGELKTLLVNLGARKK